MKKFYIEAIREIKGRNRRIRRKVPAKNMREAIKNCSYQDEIISCEPYDGQDLISPARACLNTGRRYHER